MLLCTLTSFYNLSHFPPLTLLSFKIIQFPFDFRNIYSLSLNFLTYFFPFYFFSQLFFPNCFSSFHLCLISSTLLFSALPPSPSLPSSWISSPLFPISGCRCCSCGNLRHSRRGGVEGGGAEEGPCHMYSSHSACKRRRILPVQVLGQWFLSTGWGIFI